MKTRRVVVKIGSSSLTDSLGRLSTDKISALVQEICELQLEEQCQVIMVSSGAVATGLDRLKWNRATITLPEKQAAAAVGQGLLVNLYERLFAEQGVTIGQLLLTRSDMEDRKRFVHIRNTVETLLRHGIIPVVNENDTVAVEEIRFGDNDTLASLVALVAEADLLVLLTDIDGLYDADPRHHQGAKRIQDVWQITDDLEQMAGSAGTAVGTGGMITKLTAARIGMNSGIDVVIASSAEPGVLRKIMRRDSVGTTFHADPQRLPAKKSWLAHGARTEGQIVVDEGAVHALAEQSASLLVPGVVSVAGDFQEDSIVELIDEYGSLVAKGVVHISAADLRVLLARKSAGERLIHGQEVVHRNHMVLMREENRV
ncbi:glutamate 5-kinase [Alicyclobacillus tolerans]|uniref:glutamate 5-kinase n=1 Tax=Alicyclobacillus tolerans TaxID=90970 RepID=UPI001EFFB13A|nr:glutamate 5-kinase [Alicyclobacillus tolerans]MCF8564074.1 glutamate 5-kinase [Alicyclobacillus tolerans]